MYFYILSFCTGCDHWRTHEVAKHPTLHTHMCLYCGLESYRRLAVMEAK